VRNREATLEQHWQFHGARWRMRRGLVRETASDCGAVVVFGGAFGDLTVLLGAFGFFPQRQDLFISVS